MSWRARLGVTHAETVGGGDINEAWRAMLDDGRRVFVKTHASPPPGMYAAEARGLDSVSYTHLTLPTILLV